MGGSALGPSVSEWTFQATFICTWFPWSGTRGWAASAFLCRIETLTAGNQAIQGSYEVVSPTKREDEWQIHPGGQDAKCLRVIRKLSVAEARPSGLVPRGSGRQGEGREDPRAALA